MSQKPFFITTAIDYANGLPHPGHALEKIGADAIARYKRQLGHPVHFLMGMDEHGQKVAQSAKAAGVNPLEWTDRIASEWTSAWRSLDISYDDFIRTTDKQRHLPAVVEMIRRMQAKGDIYRAKYAGFYCVGCEAYKSEDELIDGRCAEHPTRQIQWMEEDDWFFRLSAYQQQLLQLLDQSSFVQPESRRNEVRRMIENIKDFSVSRAGLEWGIRWPGDPEHAVYVWIDALTNYLSATGFPNPGYDRIWPADLHVIGKDIIRFHCVYWPAMLMSAEVALPGAVWAHGWMTMGGGKISKSEGVSFTLQEAVDRHGADAFRYFVLREVPWDGDGSFTWERFDERYTSDLANDLGNLANRTLAMLHRYRGGVVPSAGGTEMEEACRVAIDQYRDRMERYLLHEAVTAAMQLVSSANSFIETRAPWKLAKDPALSDRLDATLAVLVKSLAVTAVLLSPVMPGKMRQLWTELGGRGPLAGINNLETLDVGGWRTSKGVVLFPKPDS